MILKKTHKQNKKNYWTDVKPRVLGTQKQWVSYPRIELSQQVFGLFHESWGSK